MRKLANWILMANWISFPWASILHLARCPILPFLSCNCLELESHLTNLHLKLNKVRGNTFKVLL